MNTDTQNLMEELASIRLAFMHKPFNPISTQHQAFLKIFLERTEKLKVQYPFLNMDKETAFFSNIS